MSNLQHGVADAVRNVKSADVSGDNAKIRIASFRIAAALDSIPHAYVEAALGIDMSTNDEENLNNILISGSFSTGDYVHASVIFKDLSSQKQERIFDGIVVNIQMVYTVKGINMSFSLIHWAGILNVSPMVCSALSLEGAASWSAY